jgi:hypothetical protein
MIRNEERTARVLVGYRVAGAAEAVEVAAEGGAAC